MTQSPQPSPYSQEGSAEKLWRRPDGADGTTWTPPGSPGPGRAPNPAAQPYAGPPRPVPANPDWKPRTLIEVPPANTLPPQDDAVLDEQEKEARTVTYGIGMVTGAIALIILIVLCGRVLF